MTEESGLSLSNTSLAGKLGLPVGNFFKDIGSALQSWTQRGLIAAKQLLSDMASGAKELIAAIARGDWNIFKNWLNDDPVAVAAGMGAVLLAGGVVIGGIASAVGGVATFIGGLGITGTIGAGTIASSILGAAVGAGTTVWNFDFNKSDEQILAEINSAFQGLAGTAGENTGRAIAGVIFNRGKEPPKLRIDVTRAATLFLALEDSGDDSGIAEEVLEELSSLGWAFARFAGQALFSIGYINFRQWARKNVRTGIKWVDSAIASWGTQSGKPWVISQKINEVVEAIEEKDAALGNFVEGLLEGFGDGLQDFLRLEYR